MDAREVAAVLEDVDAAEPVERAETEPVEAAGETWRCRLWRAPSEARLGLPEVVEALGTSRSWVYQRTRSDAEDPLPHAKLSGGLVFRAGELRHWIREHEDVQVAGPSDPPEGALSLHEERRAS